MDKLIEVNNLKTYFNTEAGVVKAVDDGSFDIYKGEVLGICFEPFRLVHIHHYTLSSNSIYELFLMN